jgi:hypothetical protein
MAGLEKRHESQQMALVAHSNDRDERRKSTPFAEVRPTAVEFTPMTPQLPLQIRFVTSHFVATPALAK